MFSSVKEVEAQQLAQWLENETEPFRVIDVREIPELASGVVPGARAVPLATLPLRTHEFGREDKLVLVCRSGARSAQACMFLQQQGYANVYNLRGGMMSWAGNRLPVAAHG